MWEGTARGCGGSRNILADESPVRAEQLVKQGDPSPPRPLPRPLTDPGKYESPEAYTDR